MQGVRQRHQGRSYCQSSILLKFITFNDTKAKLLERSLLEINYGQELPRTKKLKEGLRGAIGGTHTMKYT